jgi:hypothetical protein
MHRSVAPGSRLRRFCWRQRSDMLALPRWYPNHQNQSERATGSCRLVCLASQSCLYGACAATAIPGYPHFILEPHGENFSSQTQLHRSLHDASPWRELDSRLWSCGEAAVGPANSILWHHYWLNTHVYLHPAKVIREVSCCSRTAHHNEHPGGPILSKRQ